MDEAIPPEQADIGQPLQEKKCPQAQIPNREAAFRDEVEILTTATRKRIRKKSTRHKEVAENFKTWLDEHPNAPKRKKIKVFDLMCDGHYERARNESGLEG